MPEEGHQTIAVIDGNSLMHRAFHAIQTPMSAPDGRPTNAIFGFLSMFFKLYDDFRPDGIICAFDHGIPAFRLDAIEQYKAQRPPTDPGLKAQFPMVKELLAALAVPVVELEGWEGDDILGTLARQLAEQAGPKSRCLLVSGDKDVLQLVDEQTSVVNTRVGMSDVTVYDAPAVLAKWGVRPAQMPDFLGLMGDSSDNIPGVPGVGAKKAQALIEQFGSLDAVLEHAAEVKGKLGENLRANADLARLSRQAATIRTDLELDCDLRQVSFPAYSAVGVAKAFRELALTSQLKKALQLIGTTPSALQAASGAEGAGGQAAEGQLAEGAGLSGQTSMAGQAALLQGLLRFSGAAAQERLDGLLAGGERLGVCLRSTADAGRLFSEDQLELVVAGSQTALSFGAADGANAVLRRLLERGNLACFELKPLLQQLIPPDSSIEALAGLGEAQAAGAFDCRLAAYLLDSGQVPADIEALAGLCLPGLASDFSDTALAAAVLALAADRLQQRLKDEGSEDCFWQIEMPLVRVLVAMERSGVRIDTAVLAEQARALGAEIEGLKAAAIQAAGQDFNLDSPKQLGAILFEGLKLPPLKKKKTGYSTDASVLEELRAMHPLPGLMLEYRELAKLKSTYLDALPRLVAGDGRVHTSFNQMVTATGRLSSTDPNLQNIPIRSELGRHVRLAFVADAQAIQAERAVFLSADYSQIELRLLAHLSGDKGLIAAFQGGQDFHAATAANLFGLAVQDVPPELRSRAKAVNFGIVYGQQAYGLSQSLGIGFADAQEMIDRYFAAFPQVRRYLDETVALAHTQGWVSTLFGRRRYIRELGSSNANTRHFGERTAMNHPMQGSAADIIKLAMNQVQAYLEDQGLRSQLILQVHDELDFNAAADEADALKREVKRIMEGVVGLQVPLIAEVSVGPNWAVAH
ncbi:MAG: DNA polymerase I [Coriobacteriia bacterium]|nr:DNA polymerase I [Coriobacteriia bacterium]